MFWKDIIPEGLIIKDNHIEGYIGCCEFAGNGTREVPYSRDQSWQYLIFSDRGEVACDTGEGRHVLRRGILTLAVNSDIRTIEYRKNSHGFLVAVDFKTLLEMLRYSNPFPSRFSEHFRRSDLAGGIDARRLTILLKDCRNLLGALGNKSHRLVRELNFAHLCIFFTDIADMYLARSDRQPRRQETASRSDEIMFRLMELASASIEQHTDVGFYASNLFLSKQYLSEVVLRKTGHTIGTVLSTFRFEWCLKYINDPTMTIKEIADRMSFPDQSTFGKFFKRHSGQSPARYRADHKIALRSTRGIQPK